jgi:hypothetical protein
LQDQPRPGKEPIYEGNGQADSDAAGQTRT